MSQFPSAAARIASSREGWGSGVAGVPTISGSISAPLVTGWDPADDKPFGRDGDAAGDRAGDEQNDSTGQGRPAVATAERDRLQRRQDRP